VDGLGERAHQHRLAQPRHALEQRVAADEQACQHAVDDLVVTDDRLGDFRLDRAVVATEGFGLLLDLRVDAGDGLLSHV